MNTIWEVLLMPCTDMNSLKWDLEVAILLKDGDRLREISELITNYSEDEIHFKTENIKKNKKNYITGVSKKLNS